MGRERYSQAEQEAYKKYISSPAWQRKKKRRIALAGGRCEFTLKGRRCHRRRYLCVHHNDYTRLGNERDTDLDVLCWKHHYLEHLLWKRCRKCKQACLGSEEDAARWLHIVLLTRAIDLDKGPVNWMRLPPKEHFLALVPDFCRECGRYKPEED